MNKTGWVEKRQHERVMATLKVSYEHLTNSRADELEKTPDYLATPNTGGLWDESSAQPGTTHDVSKGGLALIGHEPFKQGERLLVKLELPNIKGAITTLAEVRWVDQVEEMNRKMYRAGLKFLSMLREDVVRLEDCLNHPK
jgi:hypothetical protein